MEERERNYFNFFTEIEDAFVRRRGAHLLVSPLDWSLIETWKEIGIPLHIVLRAIERSFDGWDARPHRHRRVNSIFYCQQEVESCYAEYRQSLVGSADGESDGGAAVILASEDDASPFPRRKVEDYLDRVAVEIAAARDVAASRARPGLAEALERAGNRLAEIAASLGASARMDAEGLERDLTALETIILAALLEHATSDETDAARTEAKAQLKAFKKEMDKAIYQQTFDKVVARRLREIYKIPRLSLFFMESL